MFQVGWKFTNALGMFFRKEEVVVPPPPPVANYLITQSGVFIVTQSGLNIKVT